jgi:hypothetical protein
MADAMDARLLTCSRCVRAPRDIEDGAGWSMINDEIVCPGCFTLTEATERRLDDELPEDV